MSDRTVVYRLRAELTQFRAQMAQGSASVKKFGDDLTKVDKASEKSRRGLDSIGSAAGKLGLVAAAGLGAVVLAAAHFDKSMSGVQAATHESTQNMELLRDAAIKAGAATAFSATEAASGIEELAKAGVSTKDILAGGLSGALSLAAAGELEVGEAAETAASAMTQFKLRGDQVGHIADLLAAGAGKAQGSVHDLGMALNQSGLVAAQTGLTIEETAGSLAAFASAGLTGSDAGTSFKTMLQSLTPSSKKAKEEMEGLGISAYDAQGNFVGITKFAASLRNGLKDLSAEQRNASLKIIFGSDAVRAASVLYQQGGKGIQEWIDKTNDAGFAAETAAIRMDNLAGDLEQFKGSLETALIGAGEGAQGPLRSLVQNATDLVNVFNRLPSGVQTATTSLLAFTALAGGSVFVFSKLVRGVNSTRVALSDLGVNMENVNKKSIAIRGGVGLAGVSLLAFSDQIHGVNSTLGDFTDVAGAAALGFAAGGPWGAAIGTGVGLLSKIGGESLDVSTSMDSLTASIDTQTGAWSDLSRQLVAKDLADVSFILQKAGVDVSGLTDAVLEGGEAFQKYRTELAAAIPNDIASGIFTAKLDELRKTAAGSKTEFKASSAALGESATTTEIAATATDRLGRKVQLTTSELEAMTKALKEQDDQARSTAHEFVGLGANLDKSKVSLGQWIRQLGKQAAALRDFRINAQDAAKKGLDEGLIASLQEAGPAGALRMKQLADATKTQIAEANKAWKSGQREVDKYVAATVHVPKALQTTIDVDADKATRLLNRLETFKFSPKTIEIRALRTDGSGVSFQHGGGFASGGYTGNRPAHEPVGVVHGKEFVFDAVSTARAGVENLYALQRKLRGYASGGFVQPASSPVQHTVASTGIDYGRLAQAMANVRPLYGDVSLQPHNYSEFTRQLTHDHQQSSLGGRRVG